jgi:hypothetical protein
MNRDFKGVWIPKHIYENDSLTPTEKFVIIEIDSLDKGDGCWASNAHLADFCRVSKGHMANLLSDMREKGLIYEKYDGEKRILRVSSDMKPPLMPALTAPSCAPEPYKESNTVSNTTTIIVSASPPQAPLPVNWDNCKTDLQRFMGYYLKLEMPEIYSNGTREQVSGFFKQYGALFKRMLATAGTLDVAKMAVDEAKTYYRKLGYPWGLKALNGNWGMFVAACMERKRRG